jgi:hypothetical protein
MKHYAIAMLAVTLAAYFEWRDYPVAISHLFYGWAIVYAIFFGRYMKWS